MVKRLVVYGLLGIALALSTFTSFSINSEREDTEMIVIVNPRNPLNPVVRNPYQEEYERMLYPVVRITSDSGTGTGVFIDVTKVTTVTGGYIITAAHVVEDENMVSVEIYSDTGCRIQDAIVVITDTVKDLALIRVETTDSTDYADKIYKAKLAPENYTPYIFTPIYTVGCSLGLNPRPSQGIISVVESDHWEVTSPILPGNSGGPIFDGRTYQVIGIAVWVKVYNGQLVTTMAGVVPINQIYEFLNHKEHKEHKE